MSTNVLVVDDSATVRQQVCAALSQAGLDVSEAVDGVDGVAKIKSGDVDCVVCDVNMPNKNGIEMVAEVKKDVKYAGLPIIMLTTEGAKDLIAKAKAAGACGWIVKPFKADMLVAAVKKLTNTN
ncbi:response regulator [Roseiconus lacunae]|uniref:Response regulator n=1 Tax=Roseiconus lacunae TaxID=2605694 RepID=A0ABT7PKF5_9BACT|nr:response regulator [Roseiconus lacunae]MCD0461076.1 response regulator [Roseiconus lacunae]MDM4016980.1 response regulator [Roseiconus lacunae]WRQ48914.1 response regulator [Stieleria sp. HD01]